MYFRFTSEAVILFKEWDIDSTRGEVSISMICVHVDSMISVIDQVSAVATHGMCWFGGGGITFLPAQVNSPWIGQHGMLV